MKAICIVSIGLVALPVLASSVNIGYSRISLYGDIGSIIDRNNPIRARPATLRLAEDGSAALSTPSTSMKLNVNTSVCGMPFWKKDWKSTTVLYKQYNASGYLGTTEIVSKYMGSAQFRGKNLTDIQFATKSKSPRIKNFRSKQKISNSFFSSNKDYDYVYGSSIGNITKVFNDPPQPFPRTLSMLTPYIYAYISTEIQLGDKTVTKVHETITYLGVKEIKVPAGTFQACKIKIESQMKVIGVDNMTILDNAARVVWLVSAGKYKGLMIKSSGLARSKAGSAKFDMVAVSLKINGK
jgi:hypothetical protein